jgi:hypothetical protein
MFLPLPDSPMNAVHYGGQHTRESSDGAYTPAQPRRIRRPTSEDWKLDESVRSVALSSFRTTWHES